MQTSGTKHWIPAGYGQYSKFSHMHCSGQQLLPVLVPWCCRCPSTTLLPTTSTAAYLAATSVLFVLENQLMMRLQSR
jgi:hypothetical protein